MSQIRLDLSERDVIEVMYCVALLKQDCVDHKAFEQAGVYESLRAKIERQWRTQKGLPEPGS